MQTLPEEGETLRDYLNPAAAATVSVLAPKRGAIYLRKSPGSGADKTEVSLERQYDECLARMQADGVQLVAVYTDVHHREDLWERTDLSALRESIKRRDLDLVYTYNSSRLAMKVEHQAILLEEGDRFGVEYRFATEQIDRTSPLAKMVWLLTGTINEVELVRIKDRTSGGKMKRLDRGDPTPFPAPYAYRWVEPPEALRFTRLVPVDVQTLVVRRIFERVASGVPARQVALALTEDGVPAPAGGAWRTDAVTYIVHNTAYKGELTTHRYAYARLPGRGRKRQRTERPETEWRRFGPDRCPPLVDADLWQRAQERLSENATLSVRANRQAERYVLRGLARCGHCGALMHTTSTRTAAGGVAHNYRCGNGSTASRLKPDWRPCPGNPTVRADAADDRAWKRFLLRGVRRPDPQQTDAQARARLGRLDGALRDVDRRLTNAAAELVGAETEEEKAPLRVLQKQRAAERRSLAAERERVLTDLSAGASERAEAAALAAALTENRLGLAAMKPGELTPAQADDMRGLLRALRCEVRVYATEGGGPAADRVRVRFAALGEPESVLERDCVWDHSWCQPQSPPPSAALPFLRRLASPPAPPGVAPAPAPGGPGG